MKVYKGDKEFLFLRFYRNTFEIREITDGEMIDETHEDCNRQLLEAKDSEDGSLYTCEDSDATEETI